MGDAGGRVAGALDRGAGALDRGGDPRDVVRGDADRGAGDQERVAGAAGLGAEPADRVVDAGDRAVDALVGGGDDAGRGAGARDRVVDDLVGSVDDAGPGADPLGRVAGDWVQGVDDAARSAADPDRVAGACDRVVDDAPARDAAAIEKETCDENKSVTGPCSLHKANEGGTSPLAGIRCAGTDACAHRPPRGSEIHMSDVPIMPTPCVMFPRQNMALLVLAKAVHDAMVQNPNFPDPSPTMAGFAQHIADYEAAEVAAAGRGKGAATWRNAKRKKVREDLNHLRDYVQLIAEQQATPVDAAAVITSAFMKIRPVGRYDKPELAAKNVGLSGTVRLDARAVGHSATYYWAYSVDQVTWVPVKDTMKASTVITGLTSAKVYYFRFRAMTRKGDRDWSQVVSLLVQ